MFSFPCNRSQLSQRKVGTWPHGSEPSATWSVLLRPRMVCGKCSRWPPGRHCRSAAARRTIDVCCCKMATTHGQFYPGATIPRGTGLGEGRRAFLDGTGREGGEKSAVNDYAVKWRRTDFTLGLGLAAEGRVGQRVDEWGEHNMNDYHCKSLGSSCRWAIDTSQMLVCCLSRQIHW